MRAEPATCWCGCRRRAAWSSGAAAPAAAQIYASRDADGTLVLSDQPLGGSARTYAVQQRVQHRAHDARRGAPTSQRQLRRRHRRRRRRRMASGPSWSGRSSRSNRASTRAPAPTLGAMGLMQLMPATAADLGVRNPCDPRAEHPRRRRLPAAAARSVQRQRSAGAGRLQRRPGRGEPLRRHACRPIARRATTSPGSRARRAPTSAPAA